MTQNLQLLDPFPIVGIFLGFAVISLLVYELGFRLGKWWQGHTPDEKEGPTGMILGSVLGLLAFLLAVTMGLASDRFETRRSLVLQESNSIGTTYLRAGYLPEPYATDIRKLLREYAPLRINVADRQQFTANLAASTRIQNELWTRTEELARQQPESVVLGLFIDSLNETIDLQESRAVAIVYGRVPETILILLFLGEVLTLGVVGYNAGLQGTRGVVTAVVLVLVLGAVLTLVVDLDRPRDGFLQVSQQPLIDLSTQLGAP